MNGRFNALRDSVVTDALRALETFGTAVTDADVRALSCGDELRIEVHDAKEPSLGVLASGSAVVLGVDADEARARVLATLRQRAAIAARTVQRSRVLRLVPRA